MVYKGSGEAIGKPRLSTYCLYVYEPMTFELSPSGSVEFNLPGPGIYALAYPVYYPFCGGYEGEYKILPKGIYYTQFRTDINYNVTDKEKPIKDLPFKIEFQVE
jgi:hypothetical protein